MASILHIDRNSIHRRVLRYMLRQQNHTVVAVNDSLAAMERIAGCSYDLLIVDLALDGIEELSTVRQLQHVLASCSTPILVTTDNGREANRREAITAGARLVLTRPFSVAEIGAAVQLLLGEVSGGEPSITVPVAHFVAERYLHEDSIVGRGGEARQPLIP